jgi:hypothetical protein
LKFEVGGVFRFSEMPVDPFQSRMRWALSIFVLTFYFCWLLLGVSFAMLSVLLNQPLDFHKQIWVLGVMAGFSLMAGIFAMRFYWMTSIRRGRLKLGLCVGCGNEIGKMADICEKCGKEQPRKRLPEPSAFPVLPIEKSGEDGGQANRVD